MVDKNKTCECACAVSWDTALKSYSILQSLLKYAKIEQANKRKFLLAGLGKNLLACRSEKNMRIYAWRSSVTEKGTCTLINQHASVEGFYFSLGFKIVMQTQG